MTKTADKKVFAWDTEIMVKEITVSDYEKRVISITSLNKKEFVCITTHKKIKDAWKPVKNNTIPKEIWGDIVDAVGDYDLQHAFGGTQTLQAPSKAKKVEKEPQPQKAPLQGKKTSYIEKLKRNPNWQGFTKQQQEKALQTIEVMHAEYGMLTIGLSKTGYQVSYGKAQTEGEKEIRKIKGFSRAQMTFFA